MGGHDGSEYNSDVLLFNLGKIIYPKIYFIIEQSFLGGVLIACFSAVSLQYEVRHTNGKAPSPRGYHAAVLADSRLFVFGGFNGHAVYDDVHILDLAAAGYLPQVTSFKIDG
jgi:hypothetical protein